MGASGTGGRGLPGGLFRQRQLRLGGPGARGLLELPELPEYRCVRDDSDRDVFDPLDLSLLVFNVEYGGSKPTDAVMADRRRRRGRRAGVLQPAAGDRGGGGLPLLRRRACRSSRSTRSLSLPAPTASTPNRGPTGRGRGAGQHPPRLRPGRARPAGPGRLGLRRAGHREEIRLSSVDKLLPSAKGLLDEGWPVVFTGDLNEASHLDWTRQTASQHGGVGPVDVAGQQGSHRCRLPRLLPRGAPGPGGRPRQHLGPGGRQQGRTAADRLRLRRWPDHGGQQRGGRRERAAKVSTADIRSGRPTTGPCSRG